VAFIDLTTARARVEGTLLTDTCVITRNPSEFRDAGFDETTGDYIPPGTETPIVYGPGICAIAEQSRSEMTIAGAREEVKVFVVVLPWASPTVLLGDTVEVTASADPVLVGQQFEVHDVKWDTRSFARRLLCERRFDAGTLD
jgi:hypothetical protein